MAARIPQVQMSKPSGLKDAKHLPKPYKMRRFYTPTEVAQHNTASDCWVSFFYGVYDLSKLLAMQPPSQSELCVPIYKVAGCDITHWFDPFSQEVSVQRLDLLE